MSAREGLGGRAVVAVVLGLVVLVGGGYAAAGALAGDGVPRGTTAAGIDIGGLSPQAARDALEEGLAEQAAAPIVLDVDGTSVELDPAAAGLAVDYDATVAEAGGGSSWAPDRLWDYWTGGDDLEAVVTVDDAALDAALGSVADQVGTDPVDGTVRFTTGGVRTTRAVLGEDVDLDAARDAVLAAYPLEQEVDLDLVEVAPQITDADVETAVAEFANPALAAPVTLDFGGTTVRLRPDDYRAALSLEPVDGSLQPDVDTDVVLDLVADATAADEPVDATVRLVDGEPTVIKAKPGVDYEPDDVTSVFLDLLPAPEGERTGEVEATVVQPDFTTRDARRLGIKEEIASFTTYYPHAEYRNVNIGRAAELADGTLLMPGEIFSMNDVVGERTRENGFTEGFVISNGILREDLGGGVSQLATTLYNAGFFAGYEDVEHRPHSFYISRYPVGREATVVFGALDMRFRNDTKHGALVEATVDRSVPGGQGVVTVRIYSTKTWDITARASDRYAYTQPETRTLRTEDCYAYEGSQGFSIDVFRDFRRPGKDKVVKTEKIHTDYTPSDGVRCAPPRD